MNKETSLENILSDVVMFFDRNKKLIISITLFAVIVVFLFQKLKPAFLVNAGLTLKFDFRLEFFLAIAFLWVFFADIASHGSSTPTCSSTSS